MKFKNSKSKGEYYEKLSCDFWSKELKVDVRQMPGSGSVIGMAGDLMVRGTSVLKEFCVDVKAEQGLIAQRGLELYKKMRHDSNLKKCFLEIYLDDEPEPYILMRRKDLAKVLYELDGYRNENGNN